MTLWIRGLMLLAVMLFLAACGGDEEPLPTLAVPGVQETTAAQTAQPTPTNTRPGPTLPPTWTPEPSPTVPTATNSPEPSPTIEVLEASPGTIYYVYNEDAVIALEPETGFEEIVQTFGVDVPITDLTLSPDGSLLAFVAPGAGSAREVFVMTPDASYLQQVSCLGFAEVLAPAWGANSDSLAFIGAQATGMPRGLYVARVSGSGNCPADNGQRLVFQSEATTLTDVAWHPSGDRVYFSNITTFAADLVSGVISQSLTDTRGFGNDFNLVFDPANPTTLTYIRPDLPPRPGLTAGVPFLLPVDSVAPVAQALPAGQATSFDWRADGGAMVIAGVEAIFVYDRARGTARAVIEGLPEIPQVVYRPDGAYFAYTAVDENGIAQLYRYDTETREITPLTQHTEGTIRDLMWAQGDT